MATRTFCDWCDEHITTGGASLEYKDYDSKTDIGSYAFKFFRLCWECNIKVRNKLAELSVR